MEEKEVILTQEGYDNLDRELNHLKTEKRAEIAERIKVALGFGDLSENSEYDEAKTDVVQVGNVVKVLDIEFNEEIEYTIVGSTEVNLAENKISNESPLGKALLGAKKKQTVDVVAPVGVMQYKILDIKK